MLNDTLQLRDDATALAVSLKSWLGPQRTLRSSADGKTELTIGHQASNENPGYDTQRSVVRIQKSFEIEDSGKSVKAYVQFTMSVPKETVTANQMANLVAQLINFLTDPNQTSGGVGFDDCAGAPLLYAAEP